MAGSGGGYQVRFLPEDGRPPRVLARTRTAAGGQGQFAVHLADLRTKGERGRLELVDAGQRGRFAGHPIRAEALAPPPPPWAGRGGDEGVRERPAAPWFERGWWPPAAPPGVSEPAEPEGPASSPARPWWRRLLGG
jgi:hypothetical protein